jgi:hypothetical protein
MVLESTHSNTNEYLKCFLGLSRPVRNETLTPSCADYLEIWEPQNPGNIGDSLRVAAAVATSSPYINKIYLPTLFRANLHTSSIH